MRLELAQRLAYVFLVSSASAVAVGIQPHAPHREPQPAAPDHVEGSRCELEHGDGCDTLRRRQAGSAPGGGETDRIPRPAVGNVPYGTVIEQCRPGTMALTFDDGPGEYTSRLLDTLDRLGVKATFFITGNNGNNGAIDDAATGYPELLRRMHGAGHQLASHTWSHQSLDAVDAARRRTEVMYNEMAFRNIFGFFPTYLRPPYLECGGACLAFLGENGYHVVSTNSDTKDYENDDPALIANSRARFSDSVSRDAASHGYIVLAHDIHLQTVVNLAEYMVLEARSRGYQLTTVGDCLGDARENWYRRA